MNETKMSPEIGKLAEALAAAQAEFKPVHKGTENPFFNAKYADLSAVIAATQPALSKNGLVVIQSPLYELTEQKAGISTMLVHSSGQWISNDLLLPATMREKGGSTRFDAQSVGSAITYARRYAYQAMVGVAAEVDDDANAVTSDNGHANGNTKAAQQSVADRIIAEKQAQRRNEMIEFTPWKEHQIVISGMGVGILGSELGTLENISTWDAQEKHRFIAKGDLPKILKLCEMYKIPTKIHQPVGQTVSDAPVRSTMPAFKPSDKGATKIIKSTKMKHGTTAKKVAWELMEVVWGEQLYVCWHKSFWPFLEDAIGQEAKLETLPAMKANGNPTIEGIECIGDTFYEVINGDLMPIPPEPGTDEQNYTV